MVAEIRRPSTLSCTNGEKRKSPYGTVDLTYSGQILMAEL